MNCASNIFCVCIFTLCGGYGRVYRFWLLLLSGVFRCRYLSEYEYDYATGKKVCCAAPLERPPRLGAFALRGRCWFRAVVVARGVMYVLCGV